MAGVTTPHSIPYAEGSDAVNVPAITQQMATATDEALQGKAPVGHTHSRVAVRALRSTPQTIFNSSESATILTAQTGLQVGNYALVSAFWSGFTSNSMEHPEYYVTVSLMRNGALLTQLVVSELANGTARRGGGTITWMDFISAGVDPNPTYTLVMSRFVSSGIVQLIATENAPAQLAVMQVGNIA